MERLSAAARPFGVGVVKHKLAFYFGVDVVHLHSYHEHEGLLVDQDFNVFVLNDFIKLMKFVILVLVVHDIGIPIASPALDSQPDAPDILAFAAHQLLDPIRRILRY